MEHNFCFYLDNDFFDVSKFGLGFVSQHQTLLEVPRQLEADAFYNGKEFKELCDFFENDSEYHTSSKTNLLNGLVDDFAPYKPIRNNVDLFEIIFAPQQSNLKFCDYFLHKQNTKRDIIVLSPNRCDEIHLLVVESENEFYPIKIKFSNSAEDAWQYIQSKLPPRIYEYSHKHGNDKIPKFKDNKGKEVSQLLSSDKEAQKLLDTAVFDVRKKEKFHYNFDDKENTFIVFPSGNNKYHAYHIKDNEWEKEIPSSIRKYFKKP